jgi:periplasmic divalent cation tolerance protein
MSSGIVSVYVTFADAEEAERIGNAMVEERLAARINILGTTRSIYRWQGKIETASECAAIFKTSSSCAELLVRRIAEAHSYENPAVVVWLIEVAPQPYVQWVRGQLR